MQPLFSITLPLPLKVSFNEVYAGIHWAKRKQHADLYHWALLKLRTFKVPKKALPLTFQYIFTFQNKPLDASNCSYMVKLLEDALVIHGVISSDTIKDVQSVAMQSVKGDEDKVRIIALPACG